MKKLISVYSVCLITLQLFFTNIHAAENTTHQINFSITLSGHVILGIGYTYFLNDNHAIQATFLSIPEKGFPFGLNAGYNYFWEGEKWRPNLGAEFTMLISPPDPDKRKILPLIKLVPGIRHDFNEHHNLNSCLWIAYFPTSKRVRIAPIGLDFRYGLNL